jgi:DNA-binding response OmpR family regulator
MSATLTWNVLLIEDNPGDANLVFSCLRDFDGVELFHAPDGALGSCFLHRHSPFEDVAIPDLVLLDLGLPIFSGFDVLRGMRESKSLAKVPVVVLTSSTLVSDRDRCLDLGALDYVIKPIEWGVWQVMMRRILRRYLKGFSE